MISEQDMNRVIYLHENATYLDNGCIESNINRNAKYPYFKIMNKNIFVHRYLLSLLFSIENLQVNHKCNNSRCINLKHLYVGTQQDNMKDRKEANHYLNHKNTTHCPKGHEYSPENTRVYKNRRFCRKCDVLRRKK